MTLEELKKLEKNTLEELKELEHKEEWERHQSEFLKKTLKFNKEIKKEWELQQKKLFKELNQKILKKLKKMIKLKEMIQLEEEWEQHQDVTDFVMYKQTMDDSPLLHTEEEMDLSTKQVLENQIEKAEQRLADVQKYYFQALDIEQEKISDEEQTAFRKRTTHYWTKELERANNDLAESKNMLEGFLNTGELII